MTAILKKELSSYFTSAIGYVVMAVYYFFAGLFFYFYCIVGNSKDMASLFSNMFMITVLVIPIITMKTFSEEKKQKTDDQALLTSPLGLGEIVAGKFFGSLIMFICCVGIYVLFALTLTFYSTPDWSVFLGNLLGSIILGAAMISIDIFISSLTESMIISAIVSMCFGLVIFFIDSISQLISVTWISTAISSISFVDHYSNFTKGILSVADTVFFLSIIALFNFLTLRVLEKRRWS